MPGKFGISVRSLLRDEEDGNRSSFAMGIVVLEVVPKKSVGGMCEWQ